MSNQEKKILTNKLSGVVVLITYYPYAFGRYGNGLADANDLKFWTGAMLLFIGIGVVASIIIMIIFHIPYAIAIAIMMIRRSTARLEPQWSRMRWTRWLG